MGGYKRFGILLCLGVGLFLGPLIGIPEAGAAGEALKVDTGDTAWVLTSTALVLAMTMPGLALFLGRDGSTQEYPGDDHAEHYRALSGQSDLDSCRVQSCLRSLSGRSQRKA